MYKEIFLWQDCLLHLIYLQPNRACQGDREGLGNQRFPIKKIYIWNK